MVILKRITYIHTGKNLDNPINGILLQNNGLTRFESSVFYSIVKQIIDLENPLDEQSWYYKKPIRSSIDISHSKQSTSFSNYLF